MCSRAYAQQQEKPLQWEARAPQLQSSPCSQQLEKKPVHAAMKTPHSQTLKKKKNALSLQTVNAGEGVRRGSHPTLLVGM